jgi:geranylgeranyl diphosphate synthase type II
MELIHRRKTGAMIDASLRLGGMIAGAPPEHVQLLSEFGKNFGLAFQITDDLLDSIGDEEFVGKRLRKDADKKKLSYPTLLGIEESKREAEATVDKACAAIDRIPSENRLAYDALIGQAKYLLVRRK